MISGCSTSTEPQISLETSQNELKVGQPVEMTFSITDQQGRPTQKLMISHERILHVVVIGEDFEEFFHIHPEDLGPITEDMKRAARFTTRFTPQKAGRYLVSTDFAHQNGHTSKTFQITVDGEPAMTPPSEDFSAYQSVDGYEITLTSHEPFETGKNNSLHFNIFQNQQNVTDLEPYLGAAMHVAIVRKDFQHFIHTHGMPHQDEEMDHVMDHSMEHHTMLPDQFGPELEAEVVFPTAGTYHVFAEFKHLGKTVVTHFQIPVK